MIINNFSQTFDHSTIIREMEAVPGVKGPKGRIFFFHMVLLH